MFYVTFYIYLRLTHLLLSSVSQAVKDLIEELVVENQIEKDKIGAGRLENIFTASSPGVAISNSYPFSSLHCHASNR